MSGDRTVALDLTRLALAPVRRAPRGIDRVELAYADHFLRRWPGDCLPVLPMPWGVRCYRRRQGVEFLEAVEALWRENVAPTEDVLYRKVVSFLAGGDVSASLQALRKAKPTLLEQSLRYGRLLRATGFSLGRPVARALPEGSVYLNVGQLEVYRPFLSWLHRRPDVRSVFMIHDLIPLELPEHHLEIGIRLHERIVRNTCEFGRALIVPSEAVGASVRMALARCGRTDADIHVERLAVGPEFLGSALRDPELPRSAWFLVCGTLDSYKNHILLVRVWRDLVRLHGASAPKLVIAGGPGVTGDHVLEYLRSHPEIGGHVMLSSGLSTGALRRLMKGATALLMPSLAEGFGLPVIEALAQGTPVFASDISAHREAGAGGNVTYVPPDDHEAWLAAIEAATRQDEGALERDEAYRPRTWTEYFDGIDSFLSG